MGWYLFLLKADAMKAIVTNNPSYKMIKIVEKINNLLKNNYLKSNLMTIIDYVTILIDYHDRVALSLLIIWVGSAVLHFITFSLFDNKNNHKR